MTSIITDFVTDVTTTFRKMNFREFCMQTINLGEELMLCTTQRHSAGCYVYWHC